MLEILYRDDWLVAIHKPSGLLVHRSPIAAHEERFAVQLLRDQLSRRVYPAHRLDRGTSGVLLFALDREVARTLAQRFEAQAVDKRYLAVVRGHPPEHGVIDHALVRRLDAVEVRSGKGAGARDALPEDVDDSDAPEAAEPVAQPARTRFRRLATVELPHAVDRYPSSRYALVELFPETGRRHQLRRHLKHIAHPIIGDATYGKGRHNRLFQALFGSQRLLLACTRLALAHPVTERALEIEAPVAEDFAAVLAALGWQTAQRNTFEAESRLSAARGPAPERHPSHDTPGKTMNPLLQVRQHGQQIWLDNLSRTLLEEGHLARFIADDGVAGVTTNPAIFHKAISGGRYYEDDLAALKQQPLSAEARYEALVIPDVQRACELLAPLHRDSGGSAGYVSLEVSPALAHDADGTVAAGLRLKAAVDRPNLLIKVPATQAGLVAIERLIGEGVSVNVTLMFSLAHCEGVAEAYLRGLARLRAAGGDVAGVMSVASLFLSRVDTLVDKLLEERGGELLALRGGSAVAMARLAYEAYQARFHGAGFEDLAAAGARPQFMLWASTGTKNPAYSDLLYVEPLIGAETINTLPDATLDALRDHGRVASTLEQDVEQAAAHFTALAAAGIDLVAVGERLQQEGLAQFEQAFAGLLALTA